MTRNERDAQKAAGQRVLVLWLCWLALAALLIAGGVVGLASAPAPAAAPWPESADGAVGAAGRSVAGRDEAQAAASAPNPEADVQRTLAVDDVLRARVRFRLARTGMADTHYTGALQVHVDGAPLAPLQVVNRDPVEFALPRAGGLLRCDAPGCAPVEQELPPAGAWPDPIEVKFWANAGLAFEVVGLPADWQGVPTFAATSKDHEVQLRDVRNWRPGAPTSCAFLPGAEFTWRATLRSATSVWLLRGREPALQNGEQRTVVIDCHDLSPVRYQVIGPSAQLLPHLVVLVRPPLDAFGAPEGARLKLTDTGRFERCGSERCTFAVAVIGGFGELLEEPAADGVALRPSSPLVGLQWRDGGGQLVAFSLAGGPPARLHVCERAHLPERLLVHSETTGPRRILVADLPSDSDLIDLDRVPGEALGAVVVTVHGEPPPSPCALQVVAADGAVVATRSAQPTTSFATLDPGIYGVRWSVAGAPGPWVAQRVTVSAGGSVALLADWPAMVTWTGEVAGHLETPPAQRFLNVRFGDHPRMTAGTWTNVDPQGRFRFGLPAAEQPDAVVTLRCAFMHVRAEVVALDRERRHLVVRPPEGLRWVDVRVELEPGAAWCATLWRRGIDLPWMMLWSLELRPIVVPPGVVLGGALRVGADQTGDVLAWFEVDGMQSPVVVRRAAGRTVEFRNAGAADRMLVLVGPRGQYDSGHALSRGGTLRLFVPDGTRGIWIHDPARPDANRPECAIEPGDVMLVR